MLYSMFTTPGAGGTQVHSVMRHAGLGLFCLNFSPVDQELEAGDAAIF